MFNINFYTKENKQKKNYQLSFLEGKRILSLVGEKMVKMDKIYEPEIILKPCSVALFDVKDVVEDNCCFKLKKSQESDSNLETSSDHSS